MLETFFRFKVKTSRSHPIEYTVYTYKLFLNSVKIKLQSCIYDTNKTDRL